MENYNEACMQDMYEMFLFYTGISVFWLKGDTWNQRIFLFFYYHPTLILLLQLVLSLYFGDFCFAYSFCSSNEILCSCFIKIENIPKRMMLGMTFLLFYEADSAGQMCSVFAFPPMIIYNYANCFSSTMFFIYYGSINLLWLFKIVSHLLMELLSDKNQWNIFFTCTVVYFMTVL